MRAPHIAFFSFPHPPEVNPTISIVNSLVRRGFRVSYVTSQQFATRIAATGATVVPCPAFNLKGIYKTEGSELDVWRPVGELAVETIRTVTPHFAQSRPDLVICDSLALAGLILARHWGVPSIQTTPMFAIDRLNFTTQIPDARYREDVLRFDEAAIRFMGEHDIEFDGVAFHQEGLNIHLFPQALQIPGAVFGSQYFYAGRCAAEQPHYGQWQIPDDTRLNVLITNSTTYSSGPEFFAMCIEALRGRDWHVSLSIGGLDAALLEPLPPNFHIVRDTAHVKLLPYMDLLICPGGIVTQAEALYHGVPLVAVSHGFRELEWVSDNITRLGVGLHLRKADTRADRLEEAALHALESPAIRQNVAHMKHLIQREPGGEETANRIEEYLASVL